MEMRRIRTQDEPSIDEWLSLARENRPSHGDEPSSAKDLYLFDAAVK